MKVITSIFTDDYKWYDDSFETLQLNSIKTPISFKYLQIQEGALMKKQRIRIMAYWNS